jgi:tetratricopeptide (TPR) repeat protein
VDFNVLLVLVFGGVCVATLIYIFLDQRHARASQPPAISTLPMTSSAAMPAPAMSAPAPRRASTGPPADTSPPKPPADSPQSSFLTTSGRLRGAAAPRRTRSQPLVPINDDPMNLADGLTAQARRDLLRMGGGIGGGLANDEDTAPPIIRRMPTTQPPIQPALPARRPRNPSLDTAYDDAPPGTPLAATVAARNSSLDTTYDDAADDPALITRTMPALADETPYLSPRDTAPLTQSAALSPQPQYGRVFRNVSLDQEEDDQHYYLPESRAHLSNQLILEDENRDPAPLLLIGGLIVTLLIIGSIAWLVIANLFNSDKDKAPAAQFSVLVAHFGANDGQTSQEFGNAVVGGLQAASLDISQAGVRCCVAPIADDADAARQAAHYNADLVIWGDLPNAAATALAPHYHLQVNNPPDLAQRQGLPSQLLHPAGFEFAPTSRVSLEPALVDFTTGLALYYSDRVAAANEHFTAAFARGLDNPALHFYRASSLLQLGDNAGALAEYAKAGGVDDAALGNDAGLAAQLQGNLPAALADYDAALKLLGSDPRVAVVYRNRALAHLAQGQRDLAIADLTLAVAADPRYAPAWYDRCRLKFDVNADPLPASQQVANDALGDCNNALAADPQYPVALTQRGALWLTMPTSNLDNAQADLAAARDLLINLLKVLGVQEAQLNEQHSRQADVVVNREVAANKQLGVAHYWMGRAYIGRGKAEAGQGKGLFDFLKSDKGGYDKAIDEFNAALAADPNSYDAHVWMAVALIGKGDPNSAAQQLQQAKQLDPKRPLAYQQLAALYRDSGQHDKAAAEYEALLAVNPGYIYGYLQLADEYKGLNQSDKAASAYQRATAQPPISADEFRYKGIAYDNLGDYTNAAANYRQAVALNANDSRAWFTLGEDYRRLGQGQQAIAAYQQAASHNERADVADYRAGLIAQQLGQMAQAEKLWQQTISLNPQFMLAYYQLAKLAQAIGGREDDAIKYYEQTLRADPATAADEAIKSADATYDAHLQLGNIYRDRAAATADAKQRAAAYAKADAEYTVAVGMGGDAGRQLASSTSLCYVYIREGNTDYAVKLGDEMLKLDKSYAPAYSCQGQAYLLSDDPANLPKAEASLKQALALNPNDTAALVALGRTYAAESQPDAAAQQFRQALTVAPKAAEPHVGLGDLLYARQQWAAAQQEYTIAVQLDSGSARGYTGLANALLHQNNLAEAEKDYRHAIELDQTLADPHLYLGQLLAAGGKIDAALAEYQAAAQLRPRWPLAQYQLGKAYITKGRVNEAIDALTKATQLNPQYADAFYELGNAYRAAGPNQRQAAINAYKVAVAQNPNLAAAWFSLGLTYEDSGDLANARAAYAHARDTAADPDLKRQAQDGLARVGGG